MTEYISKEMAIDVASRECREFRGIFERIENALRDSPSADVKENKRGRWLDIECGIFAGTPIILYKCSACNSIRGTKESYCPDCGCDMRGETDD